MPLFSDLEIFQRLEKLIENLNRLKIDISIIHHNADLFYFTGTIQDGYLIVSANGGSALAVRRNLARTLDQTPVRPIIFINSVKDLLSIAREVHKDTPSRIGISMDVLPTTSYFFFKDRIFPSSDFVDISMPIRLQRAVKSEEEVNLMRGAAEISNIVYNAAKQLIKEDADEWDVCVELEAVARKNGHLGFIRIRNPRLEMYFGHVLSGPEAAVPSYGDTPTGGVGLSIAFAQGSTRKKIRKSEVVSVDTMICSHGYLNDQTRNFSLGTPPEKLMKAYELSVQLHDFFKKEARAGVVASDLYDAIIGLVNGSEFSEYFMGVGDSKVSFIGHGLGIEVDEFPFIAKNQKMILQAGMVVAFEPKFVIPNLGIAGLENTYLITDHGAESISISPEELVIL